MNNDMLNGISGFFSSELPLNKPNKASNQQSGDFLNLLQQQLGDVSANSMTGELTGNTRIYSVTGINAINPLLAKRPEKFEMPVKKDQPWETENSDSFKKESDAIRAAGRKAKEESASSDSEGARKLEKKPQSQAENKVSTDADAADESVTRTDTTDEQTAVDTETAILELEGAEELQMATDDLATSAAGQTETVEVSVIAAVSTENSTSQSKTSDKPIDYEALLEKISGNFSQEEKAVIIEALQGLSQQELEAITESPEAFKEVLGEMIAEMPDSEAKEQLLTLTESPELMQLLQTLTDQQKAADESSTQLPTDLSESEASVQVVDELMNEPVHEEKTDEADAVAQNPVQITETEEPAVAMSVENSENAAQTEQATTDDNRRETARNTTEKNVETSQSKTTSQQPQNEESLRQEFNRLNQPVNETASSVDQTETADEPMLANKSTTQTATAQPVTPEQAKAATEEAARKFFSLFAEKSAGGEKANSAETYSPEAVKRHSAMNNNNAGNGSNGFSSHNGTPASSMSAARPATPVPAATHIFSQMLEKAEYLKTENGSKILNMELDPGELGKLEMELTSKDGTVSARISAESAFAKARLDELAPQIKEQLLNQGVNLTEITVDISSRNPDERNRNQMSGGRNRSSRIQAGGNDTAEAIIRKNVLPNLRRAALNIKAVDVTV
ncbi:MAG: hypothetical protein CVV42_02000 [Candidatus Riflebacteria bacterium HGW-Riflebacteria-2]|jgi:flagellar hook-length control protein FliK|nr:MAG: hypothetical protein CVV42_02000 [Candidatus Riflebacteria bacterium HGW-Riflebacteria-2]